MALKALVRLVVVRERRQVAAQRVVRARERAPEVFPAWKPVQAQDRGAAVAAPEQGLGTQREEHLAAKVPTPAQGRAAEYCNEAWKKTPSVRVVRAEVGPAALDQVAQADSVPAPEAEAVVYAGRTIREAASPA